MELGDDRMAFVEFVSISKDVVVSAAAISGAYIGWQGLKIWKKQIKGNAEYDAARKLLKSAYNLRDKIASVRNPYQSLAEINAARKANGAPIEAPKDEYGYDVMMDVLNSRWNSFKTVLSDFDVEVTNAVVLFGCEVNKSVECLRECVTKLRNSIQRFHDYENPTVKPERRIPNNISRDEYFGILSVEMNLHADSYEKKVHEGIDAIEKFCRERLK